MSQATADYFADQERREKDSRLHAVAANIRNDLHLKKLLLNIEVKERKQVYECLRPMLKFAPLPYKKLMRLAPGIIFMKNAKELVN